MYIDSACLCISIAPASAYWERLPLQIYEKSPFERGFFTNIVIPGISVKFADCDIIVCNA